MAFSPDSLAASVLLAAALYSWRAGASLRSFRRVHLRFAAVMLAAFAVSLVLPEPEMAGPVGWLSGSLAATALFLAFAQDPPLWFSSAAFALAFACAVGGALGFKGAALLAQVAAEIALFVATIARLRDESRPGIFLGLVGALSLLSASLALMEESPRAALFFALGLTFLARAFKESGRRA